MSSVLLAGRNLSESGDGIKGSPDKALAGPAPGYTGRNSANGSSTVRLRYLR
jgi:hypothetical protein